jgi:hypothetical protein
MKLSRRMQRMNRKQRKGLNRTLAQAEREFIDKFGRAPTDVDPVFFDPNGDTPKPLDIEDFDRHLIDVMIKARHPWPFDPRLSKNWQDRHAGQHETADQERASGVERRH